MPQISNHNHKNLKNKWDDVVKADGIYNPNMLLIN